MLTPRIERRLRRALAGDDEEISRFYCIVHHGHEPGTLAALEASGDIRWRVLRGNVLGMPSEAELEELVDDGVRRMFGMLAERMRRDA